MLRIFLVSAVASLVTAAGAAVAQDAPQVLIIGDSISLGARTLQFIETPMVHWPESMFTAGNPWMIADPDAAAPPAIGLQGSSLTAEDLQRGEADSQRPDEQHGDPPDQQR